MEQLLSLSIFLAFGLGFVFFSLIVGRLVRPSLPGREKNSVYECGEPTIGSSWVQFDLRFYIVALFYLVFDVEVALIYPWAVIFRDFPTEAVILGAPFVGLIIVGFAYEWQTGSLDWVRSAVNTSLRATRDNSMAHLARRDPEILQDQRARAGADTGQS
ncbi:MAG: NADH-quinone oxidoreductase subunit A [Planctomycetota bacterium]|nr:NADH-quinone oxidoreductase subunit A [Planctomycetota bacterium]